VWWGQSREAEVAHYIADLTLDEVIAGLIAGDTLQVSGGDKFFLALPDSRAILAFYSQDRRAYWNPDKDTAIQDGEVDKVLEALDKAPKVAALEYVQFPSTSSLTNGIPVVLDAWRVLGTIF